MTPAPHLTLGLILTGAAGFIDVVGFIELGGYYTSFMSGNTTRLGVNLAVAPEALVLPFGLVVMFFIGSFVGSLAAESGERSGPPLVLGIVLAGLAITLSLGAAGLPPAQAMLALAAAAGAQNAVLPPRGSARLGATFVTGTLFAAGQDLARAVRGRAPALRWVQHVLVWLSLLVGALLGALVYATWHSAALAVPGAIYLALLIGFLLRR